MAGKQIRLTLLVLTDKCVERWRNLTKTNYASLLLYIMILNDMEIMKNDFL